jgi:hypothetical protein
MDWVLTKSDGRKLAPGKAPDVSLGKFTPHSNSYRSVHCMRGKDGDVYADASMIGKEELL